MLFVFCLHLDWYFLNSCRLHNSLSQRPLGIGISIEGKTRNRLTASTHATPHAAVFCLLLDSQRAALRSPGFSHFQISFAEDSKRELCLIGKTCNWLNTTCSSCASIKSNMSEPSSTKLSGTVPRNFHVQRNSSRAQPLASYKITNSHENPSMEAHKAY